jgi:predicted HTH domain antitoxin
MQGMTVELDDDIVQVLERLDQPVPQAARELIVLELYRRELITSGKAAQLLGMPRLDFIQHSESLRIPYFRMSADEVRADADRLHDAASTA